VPEPDAPAPFGYTCAWFAVRSQSPEDVIASLGDAKPTPSDWESEIDAAYDGAIFVSPPVHDWVLVVSTSLLDVNEATLDRLRALSKHFGEAQFFATHRVPESHAWARARNGEIERAFAYVGESDETLWNVGAPTVAEEGLDVEFPGARLSHRHLKTRSSEGRLSGSG
jgi:hypothetical protein